MKFFVLFSFLTIAISSLSQKSVVFFEGKKYKITNLQGIIQLENNIFIDKTEITNLHYIEYLFNVKKDSSQNFYLSQLPDSTIMKDYLSYFGNSKFRYLPVVGLSYSQVINYCKWRTSITNLQLKEVLKGRKYKVKFRLATEKEWEKAALGNLDFENFPLGMKDSMVMVFKNKFNTKEQNESLIDPCFDILKKGLSKNGEIYQFTSNLKEDYFITKPDSIVVCHELSQISICEALDLPPNAFGIHNMIGNAAEMIDNEGVAKGGSFRTPRNSVNVKTKFYYKKPNDWLGFRCVCEVIFDKIR